MMATYYLNPTLGTGSNNGTSEANAWQSWATAIAAINSAHPNMVTATEGVDLLVYGGAATLDQSAISFSSVSSQAYPFRIIAMGATPGIWDQTKPTILRTGTYSDAAAKFQFTGSSVSLWVEFVGLNIRNDQQIDFIRIIGAKTAGSRVTFRNCMLWGPTSGGTARYFFSTNDGTCDVVLENCVCQNFVKGGGGLNMITRTNSAGSAAQYLNCTLVDNTEFATGASGVRVTNCLFVNAGATIGGSPAILAGTGKNASTSASGLPGSDNTYDISASGLFVSSTDRHLTAANGWGAGPEHGTYGAYVPDADIDGQTRSGATTDAGADLFLLAGPVHPFTSVTISG
jgi:hypothetical protein